MGKNRQFDYAYNAQISVDEEHQIILGRHVRTACNDARQLGEALEQVEATMGCLSERFSADNGYMSGENLEKLEQAQVDGYVALGREGKKKKSKRIDKSEFVCDKNDDAFLCPGGHRLECCQVSKKGTKLYQADDQACQERENRLRSCRSKSGRPRTVKIDNYERLRQANGTQAARTESAGNLLQMQGHCGIRLWGHEKSWVSRFSPAASGKGQGRVCPDVRCLQLPVNCEGRGGGVGYPFRAGADDGVGCLKRQLAPFLKDFPGTADARHPPCASKDSLVTVLSPGMFAYG